METRLGGVGRSMGRVMWAWLPFLRSRLPSELERICNHLQLENNLQANLPWALPPGTYTLTDNTSSANRCGGVWDAAVGIFLVSSRKDFLITRDLNCDKGWASLGIYGHRYGQGV